MSTKPDQFQEVIDIPEGIDITMKKHMMQFQGPLGKTFKSFRKIPVNVSVNDGKVTIEAQGKRKKDYSILHTSRSLIKNIFEGLTIGYTIKMKVVYAHFPITVKVKDKIISIENFQGERSPRTTNIVGNTKVNPKGEDLILTGEVLTDITQTAANIELTTKVKNKDHRVFLDGIYIYEKKTGIEK